MFASYSRDRSDTLKAVNNAQLYTSQDMKSDILVLYVIMQYTVQQEIFTRPAK